MNAQYYVDLTHKKNAALLPQVEAFLADLCRNPANHSKFLNMLSFLEHIGSRKIMASQSGRPLDRETLKHLAEETRHAYFFKRSAEKNSKKELNDYSDLTCLAPAAAKMYFGRLDANISGKLKAENPEIPYLYVSFIVELRACWLYNAYHKILKENEAPLSLKSILAEEELHLQDMYDRLVELGALTDKNTSEFISLEANLFANLWKQVEASAAQNAAYAA